MPHNTDIEAIEGLPLSIKRYVDVESPYAWSLPAVEMILRSCSYDESKAIERLRALDHNREKAAYKQLGHTVHPRTGEEL